MSEDIFIREELQPFKHLFTYLINQNLQLTKEVKEIKMQMNKQYEDITNQQIEYNQNLTDKLNLVEENLKQHNNHLTKLDNDQQESSIQSKQHLHFVQHRLNYLSEF